MDKNLNKTSRAALLYKIKGTTIEMTSTFMYSKVDTLIA